MGAFHHLRALMVRRDFLDETLERTGWDKWKAFERDAIAWALDELKRQHDAAFNDAERSAADVKQRRAESRAAKGL